MRVKLRCPNKECRKVLVLEVPKPGVGVRCKSCGTAFRVPKSAGGAKAAEKQDEEVEDYEDELEESPRKRPPASGGSRSKSRRSRPADDYDEYEDDDYDDEEDDFEDDYDRPSRSRSRSGGGRSRSSQGGSGGSWKKVRVGVQIIAIATIVVAATHGIDLLLTLVQQLMSGPVRIDPSEFQGLSFQERIAKQREISDRLRSSADTMSFLFTLQKVRVLIAALAFIPLIVGSVFMIMSPKGVVKGLAIAALSCFSLALIFMFIHSLQRFGTGPRNFPTAGLSVIYMGSVGRGILTMLLSAIVSAVFILTCFALSIATKGKKSGPSSFCSIAAYVGIGHFGFLVLADSLGMAASMSSGWLTTMKTMGWVANIFFGAVVGLYIKAYFASKNAL